VRLLSVGILSTSVVTLGFLHSLGEAGDVRHGRAMALSALTLASGLWAALSSGLATRAALVVTVGTVSLTLALVQLEPLSVVLHLRPLHWDDWMRAAAGAVLACSPLILERAMRLTTRRRPRPQP
jgi:Ca2+-transporting ATPase